MAFDREAGVRLAAQLSFYLLLAFPALFLIALWLLGVAFDASDVQDRIIDDLMSTLPLTEIEGREDIRQLLDGLGQGAGGIGIFSIVVLVYSGSGAIGALRQAVETSQGPEVEGRRFPGAKLFDMGITTITMPVLLLLIAVGLSKQVTEWATSGGLLKIVVDVMGGGVGVALIAFLLLSWLYWVQNPGQRTWSSAAFGAAMTVGITGCIWLGLRLWFDLSGGGSKVYGALAGFMSVLLVIHLTSMATVLGAHFAASFRRFREKGLD